MPLYEVLVLNLDIDQRQERALKLAEAQGPLSLVFDALLRL